MAIAAIATSQPTKLASLLDDGADPLPQILDQKMKLADANILRVLVAHYKQNPRMARKLQNHIHHLLLESLDFNNHPPIPTMLTALTDLYPADAIYLTKQWIYTILRKLSAGRKENFLFNHL
ncbi:hypothetical protein HDV00_006220 [Rhizophlyctis rosea]|nr:hypothetical protein HDV00_006220 [Rhizophlyctis rosea]